jgi:hypothetical protein
MSPGRLARRGPRPLGQDRMEVALSVIQEYDRFAAAETGGSDNCPKARNARMHPLEHRRSSRVHRVRTAFVAAGAGAQILLVSEIRAALLKNQGGWAMGLSSQKPKMRVSGGDYGSRRARYHGLRSVARALGLRDFAELRRPHSRKQSHKYMPSADTSSFSPFATIRSAS